jgi:malate synthase
MNNLKFWEHVMSERIELSGLNVAVELQHFIETQALPGTGVEPSAFWSGLADIVAKLGRKTQQC